MAGGYTFDQHGGSLTVSGSMPVSGATFVYHGGTISGSLVLTGATLELAAPAATPDTIVLTGSNSLASDVPAGHTLRITDDFTGGSVLTSATGFTNHGSIVFETSVGYGGNLTILSGALSNAADGHVSVNAGRRRAGHDQRPGRQRRHASRSRAGRP